MGEGEEPISGQWGGIFSNGGSMVEDWRSNVNPMEQSPMELDHLFSGVLQDPGVWQFWRYYSEKLNRDVADLTSI